MSVFMEVDQVRGGGADLQSLAPEVRRASDRVEGPAEVAAAANAGFATGEAGTRWSEALGEVTASVERRQAWQGDQVVRSADDAEAADDRSRGDFRVIERQIPRDARP